jgi:hypothetical protein
MLAHCRSGQPGSGPTDDAAVPADATMIPDTIPGDAYHPPGTMVQVSSTGDDTNDGVTRPVKTLKRAIDLAATFPEIRAISLRAGRYEAATGEAFPYAVPSNVTMFGPPGGGAILVGNKTESGLVLEAGKLQDLAFEAFSVAIVARRLGELERVQVRSSAVAVHEETAAMLTMTDFDISG